VLSLALFPTDSPADTTTRLRMLFFLRLTRLLRLMNVVPAVRVVLDTIAGAAGWERGGRGGGRTGHRCGIAVASDVLPATSPVATWVTTPSLTLHTPPLSDANGNTRSLLCDTTPSPPTHSPRRPHHC
jgi:hypothetical protein